MRQLLSRFLAQASTSSAVSISSRRPFSRCSPLLFAKRSTDDDDGSTDDSSQAKAKMAEARKLLPSRYKVFEDKDTEIIFDDSVDLDVILNQKQKKKAPLTMDKTSVVGLRGKKGVFDIEELIILLREEKMADIATIKVPKELKYCEYMVLCTATSTRHIKTFIQTLNQIYKVKKHPSDPFLDLNESSNDWRLIDMANIILHVFLPQTREFYDIETLWTVGVEFDDKIQRPDTSVVKTILDKHISFLEQQGKSVEIK